MRAIASFVTSSADTRRPISAATSSVAVLKSQWLTGDLLFTFDRPTADPRLMKR